MQKGTRRKRKTGDGEIQRDAQRSLDSFRRIIRELRLTDARTQGRSGLSSAQLFVLSRLSSAPARSMSELAARTMSDRSSVAAVVRRLESNGLVTSATGNTDRRKSTIEITAKGRTLVRRMPHPPGEMLLDAMLSLPRARLRQLSESLAMVVTAMGISRSRAGLLFDESQKKKRASRKSSQ